MRKYMILMLTIITWFSITASVSAIPMESAYGYGYKKKYNETPPDLGFYGPMIEKYNGIYMGDPDEKTVYLTFDNGYEQGYTSTILDILKNKNVPATFFLTGHYINAVPDLVKRMVEEGHTIGNHSNKHLDYTTSSKQAIEKDLKALDDKIMKHTNQNRVMFFRFPEGKFDEDSLKMVDELGYISVFWTVAFVDWHKDRKNGWQHAFNEVIKQVHPGAIILLHTVSEDNAEMLDQLIDELRKRGYTFGKLEDIIWKNKTGSN